MIQLIPEVAFNIHAQSAVLIEEDIDNLLHDRRDIDILLHRVKRDGYGLYVQWTYNGLYPSLEWHLLVNDWHPS